MMARVFDLFRRLDITEDNGRLFCYRSDSANSILYYNGVLRQQTPGQIILPQDFKVAGIDERFGKEGVDRLMEYVLRPFVLLLKNDWETGGREGWEILMKYDADSARSYMSHGPMEEHKKILNPDGWLPYPIRVINWLETFHASTGAFDYSLSEAVIDEMAFRWPYTRSDQEIRWFGIQ